MGIYEIIFILVILILFFVIPIFILAGIAGLIEKHQKQKYSKINSSAIKTAVLYIEDGLQIIGTQSLDCNWLYFRSYSAGSKGFVIKIPLSHDDLRMIDIGGNIYENRGWSVSNDRKWLQRTSDITYQGGGDLFERMVVDELKKKYSHLVYKDNVITI